MQPVHFVHTSDWHLGFSQYNTAERFLDYYDAVSQFVDKVIHLNPQFVLHTGDIFHHSKPTPGTIRQAVRILRKLDKAKIPMYIIRGNHDDKNTRILQRGGGIISLLRDLKLVNYIDDTIVSTNQENVEIMGVGYYPGHGTIRQIDDVLSENTSFLQTDKFKILATHTFVEGQIENAAHIPFSKIITLGLDYVGIGHYHIPWYKENYRIFAPGSSEATSTNDWNREDVIDGISLYSSFYEVKVIHEKGQWNPPNVIPHKILVRPKIILNHFSEKLTPEDVENEIKDLLQQKKELIKNLERSRSEFEPLVLITLKTNLNFSENSRIDLSELEGYLHIVLEIIETDDKIISKFSEIKQESIEQIIMKQLETEEELADTYAAVIMDIINLYGSTPISRDMANDEFQNMIEIIDKIED